MKKISILGATGSIGTQTVDVIRKNKDRFEIIAVSANNNFGKLIEIIQEFKPKFAVLTEKNAYDKVNQYCIDKKIKTELLFGMEGLKTISSLEEIDVVVTSVVGMIGLLPTMEAIKSKKTIALANKETLVVAGELVMKEAARQGVKILPVDSEHSAIFQCLQGNDSKNINKILLTASGGPFRGKSKEFLGKVTVSDALKHPKWSMGKKISIDSATLMNKGLEVIEAHWLFHVAYEKIQVVVHPQSIIHSMVEYNDGSIIAQMSSADMRLPIQYALNYPMRMNSVVNYLDFTKIKEFTFEMPDLETFYSLNLAYEAGKIGGIMPTILNAANEAAVDLFLKEKISFIQIPKLIEECMNKFYYTSSLSIENIIEVDKEIKKYLFGKHNNIWEVC